MTGEEGRADPWCWGGAWGSAEAAWDAHGWGVREGTGVGEVGSVRRPRGGSAGSVARVGFGTWFAGPE